MALEDNKSPVIDRTKLRGGSGEFLSQALFYETAIYDKSAAIYTFKEKDYTYNGITYVSIWKLYLAENDPTEYEFAKKHFYSWHQWQKICGNKACMKYIVRMRSELSIKLRSEAIQQIVGISKSDKGFTAAKFIADKGWELKRGRPSKAEKNEIRKEEEKLFSSVEEAIAEAGITIQ